MRLASLPRPRFGGALVADSRSELAEPQFPLSLHDAVRGLTNRRCSLHCRPRGAARSTLGGATSRPRDRPCAAGCFGRGAVARPRSPECRRQNPGSWASVFGWGRVVLHFEFDAVPLLLVAVRSSPRIVTNLFAIANPELSSRFFGRRQSWPIDPASEIRCGPDRWERFLDYGRHHVWLPDDRVPRRGAGSMGSCIAGPCVRPSVVVRPGPDGTVPGVPLCSAPSRSAASGVDVGTSRPVPNRMPVLFRSVVFGASSSGRPGAIGRSPSVPTVGADSPAGVSDVAAFGTASGVGSGLVSCRRLRAALRSGNSTAVAGARLAASSPARNARSMCEVSHLPRLLCHWLRRKPQAPWPVALEPWLPDGDRASWAGGAPPLMSWSRPPPLLPAYRHRPAHGCPSLAWLSLQRSPFAGVAAPTLLAPGPTDPKDCRCSREIRW